MEKVLTGNEYVRAIAEWKQQVHFEENPQYQQLFWAIGKALKKIQQGPNTVERTNISQLGVDGVREKLASVDYHYSNYYRIESLAIGMALKQSALFPKRATSQTMAVGVRKLNFETEAFIFQTRACLDLLTGSIMSYFSIPGWKRNMRTLRNTLQKFKKNRKAKQVVQMLNKHTSLIDDLITVHPTPDTHVKRDRIAHYGPLSFSSLNVIRWPSGQVMIIPQRESSMGGDEFSTVSQLDVMKKTMDELFDIIHHTYEIILQTNLQWSGPPPWVR